MENTWLTNAYFLKKNKIDFILITILEYHGSAPRKTGTKMIVCDKEQYGSIGGGKLEWEASKLALKMLETKQNQKLQTYHLSASLGQCCGGTVSLLLEGFFFQKIPVIIFGAGHLTQALIPILQTLAYQITVVDARENLLEKLPSNVQTIAAENPQDEVVDFNANVCYLIMTHDHSLDFAIAEQVLDKKNFLYLGIVGSQKKSLRFKKKLSQKKYHQDLINKIFCPIGLHLGDTNHPTEIAISIAAQLLQETKK